MSTSGSTKATKPEEHIRTRPYKSTKPTQAHWKKSACGDTSAKLYSWHVQLKCPVCGATTMLNFLQNRWMWMWQHFFFFMLVIAFESVTYNKPNQWEMKTHLPRQPCHYNWLRALLSWRVLQNLSLIAKFTTSEKSYISSWFFEKVLDYKSCTMVKNDVRS